ncbi:MAG: CofH family radical SAM protein [Rikenellaceae bacterium]
MNFPKDTFNKIVEEITEKFYSSQRLSADEGVYLYQNAPLMLLSNMALNVKHKFSQNNIYYNRNFHIEPTNICTFNCKFCSFRKPADSAESWNMSVDDIISYAKEHYTKDITEVHLVGGVLPAATLEMYGEIIWRLRQLMPNVSIKAFSAIEHIYVYEKAGVSYCDGLKYLKERGMDSITGGGAEIFDSEIRNQICSDKPSAEKWLNLHREAHKLGIKTAATMLYGHIEGIENRINHICTLRTLQDQTSGFTTFIPLKYRNKNNSMSYLKESTMIDDLKTIAISRIMLDNVPHIKAYPPSIGIENTPFALMMGADDIDGTVNDTTKIYSMAGVKNSYITETELRKIATDAGYNPVERDTFYNNLD